MMSSAPASEQIMSCYFLPSFSYLVIELFIFFF
jgi:hypothetical protein